MKRFLFTILMAVITITVFSQPVQPSNSHTLPPFNITLADGSKYRLTDLPMGMPVLLVYFDPDCDHCELFVTDLLKHTDLFRNVQIVMVTYAAVRSLKNFVTKTGLDKFTQIRVGTEGESFIVRYHYNVIQFPYLALHDSRGMLMATYEAEVPDIQQLAAMFPKK